VKTLIADDTYTPESFKTLKHVFDRAGKCLEDQTREPSEAFAAASQTIETITPEHLLLTWDTHRELVELIGDLRANRWTKVPQRGIGAINRFHMHLRHEIRRLGL
jgi:hypothetical protein